MELTAKSFKRASSIYRVCPVGKKEGSFHHSLLFCSYSDGLAPDWGLTQGRSGACKVSKHARSRDVFSAEPQKHFII